MTEQETLTGLRKEIYQAAIEGNMAHLASSYSCLEILYTLYQKGVLHYRVEEPDWIDRDRFILSKGHAGLALYAVMMESGFLTREEFHSYLKPGGIIGGEPAVRDVPGVEASTGSLGHGILIGVGMALGQKLNDSPGKTYILIGDGECEEGTVWEAAMAAAAYGLDNLITILDHNKIQKMDYVDKIMKIHNWEEKWSAFGWEVRTCDGHNTKEVKEVLTQPSTGKPVLVLANTIKGKGVSIMEHNPNWHFKVPNKKERKVFEKELSMRERKEMPCSEPISQS